MGIQDYTKITSKLGGLYLVNLLFSVFLGQYNFLKVYSHEEKRENLTWVAVRDA